MTRQLKSEDEVLADRLVNYSDAIVALAFIVSSGLGLAIADPDSRLSILGVSTGMAVATIVQGTLLSLLLIILRRWEGDLRADVAVSDKYQRYSRHIYAARHAIVWLTVAQTVAIMLTAGT